MAPPGRGAWPRVLALLVGLLLASTLSSCGREGTPAVDRVDPSATSVVDPVSSGPPAATARVSSGPPAATDGVGSATPSAGASGLPVLGTGLGAVGRAALVLDGRLHVSERAGSFGAALVGAEAGSVRDPAWRPDGRGLAYARGTALDAAGLPGPGGRSGADIWYVDLTGRAELVVPHDGDGVVLAQPAWEPDGRALFYTRAQLVRAGGFAGLARQVERRDLASGERTIVVREALWPTVSPDGARLAFTRATDDGDYQLWVRELASGTERRLDGGRFSQITSPRFSSDGQSIAFGAAPRQRRGEAPGSAEQVVERLLDAITPRAEAHGPASGLWIAGLTDGRLAQVGQLQFDDPLVRWRRDGAHLFAFEPVGLFEVDLARASRANVFQPGSAAGFDWLEVP